ncbi:PaaI family thioesterase [Paenibacillus filicis]|uniref:PaaI family thioesterase n=1 Tax=Paenibacillus gyeongsangnamensis TaxID=3388067 RepID=A0ABT4QCV4_9BACL|nr:PaaI family thioesterase [Paenibacillus filicis]MCZ8514713.1 PaaI family thioesterase [Paenibacillus filicis]
MVRETGDGRDRVRPPVPEASDSGTREGPEENVSGTELQAGLSEELRQLAEKTPEGTFWDLLGAQVLRANGKQAVVRLDVQPHHLNMIGITHGGVYASLLDSAMGLVAMMARPNDKVVTTNLNVHFVRAADGGTITVTADCVHTSRTQITVQGFACRENGDLCAFATGSFRILEPRSGKG